MKIKNQLCLAVTLAGMSFGGEAMAQRPESSPSLSPNSKPLKPEDMEKAFWVMNFGISAAVVGIMYRRAIKRLEKNNHE